MFSNQCAELSFKMPVSAVDAVRGDRGSSRFFVGTSSVRSSEDNHLHLIKFYSEANQLGTTATLSHTTGPIRKIVTCPTDKSMLLTIAEDTTTSRNSSKATLWKIPSDVLEKVMDEGDNDLDYDEDVNEGDDQFRGPNNVLTMEEQAKLSSSSSSSSEPTSASSSSMADICWRGGWDDEPSTHGDVMTLHDDGTLTQWDVAFGSVSSTRVTNIQQTTTNQAQRWDMPPRMAWDPHHADITAVSAGTMVQLVDWREPPTSSSNTSCPHHRYGVTDLDYNPNKPHMLVTSGKDGLIKFWDLRKASSSYQDDDHPSSAKPRLKKQHPLMVARGGHRHWATRVSFNPFHDQLVLSGGTDTVVNLWRMSTISSAPLVMLDETTRTLFEDEQENSNPLSNNNDTNEESSAGIPEGPNVRVSRYEHMDSVNAITWGAADAWIYLSASYDGKVVLNHVPSKEKYKILL
jgi:WD40 repeat protein